MKKQNQKGLLLLFLIFTKICLSQVNFNLGTKAFYTYRNYTEAIYWLDRSINSEPEKRPQAYALRGLSKNYLKDYENAFNDMEEARKLEPNNPKILASIALNFTFQNKYTDALRYIDSAIVIDSTDAQFWDERATIYSQLYNFNLAIKNSKTATRLEPKTSLNFINLGYFYFAIGNYKDALTNYNIALTLNPSPQEEVKILINRAMYYNVISDYENTIKDYQRILALMPTNPLLYIKMGEAKYKLNQPEQACIDFNKAKTINDSIGSIFIDKYCTDKKGSSANTKLHNEIKLKITLKTISVDSSALIIYKNTDDLLDNQAIRYKGKNTELELSLNANYIVRFVKQGYVTKLFYVNTNIPKGKEKDTFSEIIIAAELDKEKKGEITTVNTPTGSIKYNDAKKNFNLEIITK